MGNNTLRVGGLGAGNIFNHAHVPVYVNLDSVQLTALYDVDRGVAEATRDRYLSLLEEAGLGHDGASSSNDVSPGDVAICSSPEELFEQVDLVDICAPVRWHARYATMALERNVHAMTEKPMARTWWEARHVSELAQRTSAFFQLNDDNLFIPRYQALRNIVESGLIGEVQTVWIARGTHSSGRSAWFWQPLESGGGSVMDYGTHAVTSTWFLIGYDKVPVEVRSLGIEARARTRVVEGRFQQIEIDDDAHFKVRYVDPKSGDWITVIIEATWTWPELGPDGSDVHGYVEVQGSTGSVMGYVDDQGRDFLRLTNRTFGERLIPVATVMSERESFQAEIDNFVKAIHAGHPSILDADVGTGVMSVLDRAQLSELWGRRAITEAELEAFSREMAGDSADPWAGSDHILTALMEPYRLER